MKKLSPFFKSAFAALSLFGLVFMYSCEKDDETAADPVASFQYKVDAENYLKVIFTNYSKDAATYLWNFGDNLTSSDKDPVHIYAQAGEYTVKLTASNSDGATSVYSTKITITDPNEAIKLLTGDVSKTWKLFREGRSMGIGADAANAGAWWGLFNDGKRPCLYKQSFTFKADGSFVFDDGGMIWGEGGIFKNADLNETCFEAKAENMINAAGLSVTEWMGGTHGFTYDPTAGKITVTGKGAYLGLIKLGTAEYVTVPQEAVTYDISIDKMEGYDLMYISVNLAGDGHYWDFTYVSYYDSSLEPDVVEEQEPWGTDLPDITPTSMFVTFASREASAMATIDTITSGSNVTFGVADPADANAAKVGEFHRVAEQYQELKLMATPKSDINFTNFTKMSIDVYVPSSNDYSAGLTKGIVIGIAESSQTEQWWNGHIQYEVGADTVVTDKWVTYTFDLDSPTSGPGVGKYTPHSRNDLDMFFISLGGAGHTATGTFYIRNFKFE